MWGLDKVERQKLNGRLHVPVLVTNHGRAVDLLQQEGEGARELAATYQAGRAVWEALCGNAAEGQRAANTALDLSRGWDIQYAAGLALALEWGNPLDQKRLRTIWKSDSRKILL